MTKCVFCNKELKVTFICPYCKEPYCRDHRKPEDHNCPEYNVLDFQEEPMNILDSDKYHDESNEYLTEEDRVYKDWNLTLEEQSILKNGELMGKDSKKIDVSELEEKITEDVKGSKDLTRGPNDFGKKLLEGLNVVKTPLVLLIIFSSLVIGAIIGINIGPKNELLNLQQRYDAIFMYYTDLEKAHNDLATQLQEAVNENTRLENEKTMLLINNSMLNQELEDILNYKKKIILEENKLITLPPNINHSFTFSIPFSGYITLNYSATSNISLWIGSSSLDNIFYSRIPDAPYTSTNDHIIIPVHPDLVILFVNDDELKTAVINFWLSFIY